MAERKAKKSKSTKRRGADVPLERRILDVALELAEDTGWDALRLRRVAERLDLPLAEVLVHYRDLDALADAWFRRALSHFRAGEFDHAESDAAKVLDLDPKNLFAMGIRSSVAASAGRLEEALHDANEIIKAAPQEAFGYLIRSIAHGKAGNEADAKRDLDHARKIEQASVKVQLDPYVLDCWKPARWPAPRKK